MINENMLRKGGSIGSARKLEGTGRKGVLKTKSNALGDVQNTLHSRHNTCLNQNNSEKLIQRKPRSSPGDENTMTISKSTRKNFDVQTSYDLGFHDHSLCEQADQIWLANLHSEYKLSQEQIDDIVKAAKKFTLERPFVSFSDPLEDIETPVEVMEHKSYCIDDIMGNFILPEIPAPEMAL